MSYAYAITDKPLKVMNKQGQLAVVTVSRDWFILVLFSYVRLMLVRRSN